MFALLYDPVREIKQAKRQSYSKILMYLLAASLFETAGLFFFAQRFFRDALTTNLAIYGVLGVFLFLFVAHIVVAFFFSFAMHILDGTGGYYEGLATLVLAMVAPAIAIFFAGAITFIPYGVLFSAFLVLYGYVIGAATLFRSAKEMFELDYAGVLAGFLITFVPLSALIYLATVLL